MLCTCRIILMFTNELIIVNYFHQWSQLKCQNRTASNAAPTNPCYGGTRKAGKYATSATSLIQPARKPRQRRRAKLKLKGKTKIAGTEVKQLLRKLLAKGQGKVREQRATNQRRPRASLHHGRLRRGVVVAAPSSSVLPSKPPLPLPPLFRVILYFIR